MPCSRTQHGFTRVGLEPPTSGSGVRDINQEAEMTEFLSADKAVQGVQLVNHMALAHNSMICLHALAHNSRICVQYDKDHDANSDQNVFETFPEKRHYFI